MDDPFQILGVTVNDDIDVIKERYRNWMLFLHPDKGNFQGPEADRIQLFQSIQDAYKLITSGQQIRDYPENNVDYEYQDEQIQFREDFTKRSSKTNHKVNKKFHDTFQKVQSELDQEDPTKRGYSNFSREVTTGTIGVTSYSPTDIFNSGENRFLEHTPKKYTKESHELTFYGTTDLGTNEIHDLSLEMTGIKNGISGTDIGAAFTNQITTDEQYMAAKRKYENKPLDRLLSEREAALSQVIEPLPEDTAKVEAQRKLDLARQQIQRKRDQQRSKITGLHIKDWVE